MALPLTPQLFGLFAGLIEEQSGIHYVPTDRELVVDRLSTRALDQGFESLLDYYYFIRYDAAGRAELEQLVESLLVHETYFFREADQLRALISQYLKRWVLAGRRLRVWSAACSTGEEPITLAMMLHAEQIADRVDIVASDYSTRALAKAQAGQFSRRSVRANLPPVARFLEATADGYAVAPQLIASIDWRRVNFYDPAQISRLGKFDVIICRNALIYFDDPSVRRIVSTMSDALNTDGVLVVGVSESLIRFGTALRCEENGGAFFYRKAP